jgi:hypothetical protein
MTPENAIIGNYYVVEYTKQYIIKWGEYTKKEIHSPTICCTKDFERYSTNGSFRFGGDHNDAPATFCGIIREATEKETFWLDKCIKLNTFVPFEKAMKDYIPLTVDEILKKLNL